MVSKFAKLFFYEFFEYIIDSIKLQYPFLPIISRVRISRQLGPMVNKY